MSARGPAASAGTPKLRGLNAQDTWRFSCIGTQGYTHCFLLGSFSRGSAVYLVLNTDATHDVSKLSLAHPTV